MPKSKKKTSKSVKVSTNQDIKEVKKEVSNEDKKERVAQKANSKPKKKVEKKSVKRQPKNDKNKRWFKEFRAELKKIIWPSRSELVENSVVVISMVVIVAAIIFVLDLAFKSLNSVEVEGAKKLKNTIAVSSDENTTDEETNQTTETSTEETEKGTEIEVTNSLANDVEAVWTEESTETVNE